MLKFDTVIPYLKKIQKILKSRDKNQSFKTALGLFKMCILKYKILLQDSIYIADVFMSPKLDNSSISMKEVIITSILIKLTRTWFKFNNLELALGIALKFYTSVGKWLKLKVRKCLGINSYICRSYKGETSRVGDGVGAFPHAQCFIHDNQVNPCNQPLSPQ